MNKLADHNFVNTTNNLVVKPRQASTTRNHEVFGPDAAHDFRTELNQQSTSAPVKNNILHADQQASDRQSQSPSGKTLPHDPSFGAEPGESSVALQRNVDDGLQGITIEPNRGDRVDTILPFAPGLPLQAFPLANGIDSSRGASNPLVEGIDSQLQENLSSADSAIHEQPSAAFHTRATGVSSELNPANNTSSVFGTTTGQVDVSALLVDGLYPNETTPSDGSTIGVLGNHHNVAGWKGTLADGIVTPAAVGVTSASNDIQQVTPLPFQSVAQPIPSSDAIHSLALGFSTLRSGVANQTFAAGRIDIVRYSQQTTTRVMQNVLQPDPRLGTSTSDLASSYDSGQNGSSVDSPSNFRFLLQQLSNGAHQHLSTTTHDESVALSRLASTAESFAHRTSEFTAKPVPEFQLSHALHKPEWAGELGGRVFWLAQHNLQQAQLKLNPAHLGLVEIKISVQNDVANISFSAQNAQVREAIEAALPRLRELMSEGGFSQTNADVSGQPFLKHQGRSGNGSPSYPTSAVDPEEEQNKLSDFVHSPAYFEHSTGVDYYV